MLVYAASSTPSVQLEERWSGCGAFKCGNGMFRVYKKKKNDLLSVRKVGMVLCGKLLETYV